MGWRAIHADGSRSALASRAFECALVMPARAAAGYRVSALFDSMTVSLTRQPLPCGREISRFIPPLGSCRAGCAAPLACRPTALLSCSASQDPIVACTPDHTATSLQTPEDNTVSATRSSQVSGRPHHAALLRGGVRQAQGRAHDGQRLLHLHGAVIEGVRDGRLRRRRRRRGRPEGAAAGVCVLVQRRRAGAKTGTQQGSA